MGFGTNVSYFRWCSQHAFFSFGRTAMVDLSTQILSEDSFDMCLGDDIWTFFNVACLFVWADTPWKFNSLPLKIYLPNWKVIFQPPFFRGENVIHFIPYLGRRYGATLARENLMAFSKYFGMLGVIPLLMTNRLSSCLVEDWYYNQVPFCTVTT